MLKSYKCKLKPSEEQIVLLNKHFGSIRFAYNHFRNERKKEYDTNKQSLNYLDNSKSLTELKKRTDIEKIFIIGGAMLYKACLEHPSYKHLYLNELNDINECDTFFPEIDMKDYKLVEKNVLSSNVTAHHYIRN